MKIRNIAAVALLAAAGAAQAEIPAGYYDKCENKGGKNLLSALNATIASHTNVGYDGLYNVYKSSDVRADGTVWDIYSTKAWNADFSQKCGQYKKVGDCINREHSVPQSWWGSGTPKSDAFHVYPTDGKVNGQRSNYPYGECAGGTQEPANGNVKPLGRLGACTFPGYTGKVFEPDDQYKGDLARSYFYMAACYNSQVSSWTGGNGSAVFAGNSFPVFKQWTIDLLLKWHRQDPVSQKEIDRNNAIYARQNNRNPFIDHPEMVEYIWGEHASESWTSTGTATPKLVLPVSGTTVDLGSTLIGVARTATVTVKGTGLSSDVSVSVSGAGFSISTGKFTAAQACATDGTNVTVTFKPTAAGRSAGTLTVACGDLKSVVTLAGEAVTSLPTGPVTAVGPSSFTAVWSYVGDADAQGKYTLDVCHGGKSIAGYPRKVVAKDEFYTVVDLEPSTAYTYTVASQSLTSEAPVQVTTTPPVPSVEILYDDEPTLYATAGEPSAAAELLMYADYIDGDIRLAVNAPFQLSADKTNWSTELTLTPDDNRFYLRVLSDKTGNFFTSISVTAQDYFNDDADFNAVVTAPGSAFHEDFEPEDTENAGDFYADHSYQGTMCLWQMSNAGIDKSSEGRSGRGVRMGKKASSSITMLEDTRSGMGIVTVWTQKWSSSEGECTYVLEYSTDKGENWHSAGEGQVATTSWAQQTFTLNTDRPTRIRVRQTAGKRFLLDDIEATATAGIADETPDYRLWDAFCLDGQIVVEAVQPTYVRIYALDGTAIFAATAGAGRTHIAATPGIYIVAVDDFARRVVVK